MTEQEELLAYRATGMTPEQIEQMHVEVLEYRGMGSMEREKHDGWIRVKERLPKVGGYYLTYQAGAFYGGFNVFRYSHVKKKWCGAQVGTVVRGITHWMPMPEGPEDARAGG